MARGTVRLDHRFWWECTVLYVALLCWMYIGPTSGVSRFLPPKLDVNGSYIDIPANSTLRITCYGRYPLAWALPPLGDNVSLRSSIYEEELGGLRPFKSVFELNTTDVMDLGRYTCYYNGTTDLTNTGNSTSVYVFVNDDYYLFQPEKQMDQLVFVTVRHGERSVVPCLPTHSRAEVQLWKDLGQDDMELIDLVPHYVEFDPMRGFIIYYPHSYYAGHFICNGTVPGRVYNDSSMAVVFVYLPPVDIAPNVMIEKETSFHPVLNDTFTLNCTVTVEMGVMFIMNWDYPNKNSSRIEATKPIRRDKPFGQERFMLSVVTSQLTVRDVQRSDEGLYTCSCKDHAGKTYNHSVFVSVYESEQLAHVNLTTDLNTSEDFVYPAGGTFKMVVTVEAHPSFAETRFWWRKDGRLLTNDGDLTLTYREPRAILQKANARFEDSGQYTMYARIQNATSRITINVSISSKPVVTVVNKTDLFAPGVNYTLVCMVQGTAPIQAWWEWRECVEPRACDDDGPGGVFKRLGANSPHKNGAARGQLVRSVDGLRHRNVSLMLRAHQSGLYRCVASNSLGTGSGLARFYVTDARNGFQIIAPDVIPVDQDRVTLSCLASQFKYTDLTWRWKAKDSVQFVTLNASDTLDIKTSATAFSNNLSLHFNPIGRNQSGEYKCFGYTRGTQKKRHIEFVNIGVRDMRAPEFNSTNLRNQVQQDVSYIELHCSATGLPEPSISWLKDGKPLNMSGGMDRFNEGHWLIKRKVTPQDSGFYQCRAENRAGAIYANTTIEVASGISPAVLTTTHIALVTVVCIIFTCLLVGSFLYCKRYRADMKQEKEMELLTKTLFDKGQAEMFNPELPLCEQVELLPYDNRWEFPKDRLKLGRTLGQGAFGRVVKAEAIGLGDRGQSLTVAVKMLKERADVSQRKALMAELKILIHLGRHLNIVNILGAVTKNVTKGELMVIVEYCKFGNLRHYLLRHRERFVNQLNPETGKVDPDMCYSPKSPLSTGGRPGFAISNPVYCQQQRQQRTPPLKYADLAMSATPSSQGNEFTFPVSYTGSTTDGGLPESGNHAALMSGSSLRDHGDMRDEALTTSDLLCFAFQCARGMEYLASRKLIHRDLAARNVLLSAENVVKICDFGLAKDCYKYSNYVKKGDGLLPVKWTAIESIMDRVFTTKSDVWSYGVLLWEIFSLGGNPYPGVVIDESFYKRLKNGYRMEKPDYAPDDVYEVMESCWQAEPKERPDFSTLVCRLGDLLQAGVRDYYITLNDPYANVNMLMKNNNDYLTMGGKPEPDYLDMKSDDENYINTSRAGAQAASTPHYATMATATTDGSAAAGDAIEMAPMMKCGGGVQEDAPDSVTSYVNVGGPTLQLRLPPGKRRDAPAPLLPPPGNASGDARASDDVSEVCATPPPAYNLVVSVDGSGGIAV